MNRKDRLLVLTVMGGFSFPFMVAGGLAAVWVPMHITQRIAVLNSLPLTTLESFEAAGDEVLVEGIVRDRSADPTSGMLIYNEYQRTYDDGESTWELQTSHTPEVWVEVIDGLMKIEGNYHLENVAHEIEDGDRRISGFRAGDSVLIVGTPTAFDDPPTIAAEIISTGPKDIYLAYLRGSRWFPIWLGSLFFGAGVLLSSIGWWVATTPNRKSHP